MCFIKWHSVSYNKDTVRTHSLISHKSTGSPQFKRKETTMLWQVNALVTRKWNFSMKPDGILFPYREREQYSDCKRPLTEEAILFSTTLPAIFKSFFIIHSSLLRAMLLHRHRWPTLTSTTTYSALIRILNLFPSLDTCPAHSSAFTSVWPTGSPNTRGFCVL